MRPIYPHGRTAYQHATTREDFAASSKDNRYRPELLTFILEGLEAVVGGVGDTQVTTHEYRIGALEVAIASGTVAGGGGTWGTITGTLSNQTDLQAALDGKVSTSLSITITGTANQITSSAGAQDLSANRTWTLSLPDDVNIPTSLTVGEIRGTTAIGADLLLRSTTHATKGKIVFGNAATSYYDETLDAFASGSLLANTVLYADASKVISSLSTVSTTELGYLDGVTSAIQTQLNDKEPTISAGTTAQYWRGDKSWQTLNQAAVAGLTTASSPTFTGQTLTGNATIAGYLRVGSNSAPVSTTAGDLTVLRFNQGNSSFVNLSEFQVVTTHTGIASTTSATRITGKYNPTGNSTIEYRGLEIEALTQGAFNLGTIIGNISIHRMGSSGNITRVYGIYARGFYGSTATDFGTVTDVYGIGVGGVDHFINNPTGTITNAYAIHVSNSVRGGSNLVVTNLRGVSIASQTLATNNTNLLVGSGTTGNWSIYNNSAYNNYLGTGNIGFGVTTFGTSLAKGISWGSGTAASASVTDAIQMWVADRAATAGKASLHIRTEDGTSHVLGDRVGFGTLTPTESAEFASGNLLISNGYIVDDDIVYPSITVGGSVTARTFTVSCNKRDNTAGANTRFLVHYWVSTSLYGTPATPANQTYTVTTGSNFGAVSTSTINTAYTDANGDLVLTITNSQPDTPVSVYFHIEVQGIEYAANGTVNVGTS